MSQDAFNGGVEMQLRGNATLTLNYTHSDLRNTIEDLGVLENGNEVYKYVNPGQGIAKTMVPSGRTAEFATPRPKRTYDAFEASLQKRFSQGFLFNVNYTFSRAIDTFSDEGLYQIEHDQTRPWLNRALSDFHRKHRLILSWAWDLPFRGNRFVEGWQVAGIGTFQSGRPFSVFDDDFSAVIYGTTDPRPDLAPGATHEDQTTRGPVTELGAVGLQNHGTGSVPCS